MCMPRCNFYTRHEYQIGVFRSFVTDNIIGNLKVVPEIFENMLPVFSKLEIAVEI